MKLIFTLCLCLVLAQATPIDKLRQSARPHVAKSAGGPSFVEKKTAEVSFEMEKTDDGHHVTEADAVDNLAKAEVEEAAAAATTDSKSKSSTPSDSATPSSLLVKQDQKKDGKTEKKIEWQDAVLVEDLTKERATADANTRYIGANMKSAAVGSAKTKAPDPTSFLQFGPPMFYYPVHPSFLQQAQRQRSESSENVQQGARLQGWGDYGTPLYYAQDYGSYDGLGAGGSYMYGTPFDPFNGYNPYIPPTFTPGQGPLQGGAGYAGLGGAGYAGYPGYAGYAGYHNPYGVYSQYAPEAPPPFPSDLPSPPFISHN